MSNIWDPYMRAALTEAQIALDTSQDVPVGAVIVSATGEIVSRGRNMRELLGDPTAHAEIQAIKEAAQAVGDWRLTDYTLVVTLEPCVMCAGAIQASRLSQVVYGATDDRLGAAGSLYDLVRDKRLGKMIQIIPGVLSEQCAQLLTSFFLGRRTS